jgi:acetyl-CoA acyltransferase
MRDVYIAGTGMTKFGKFLDLTIRDFAEDAVKQALNDAGCQAGDIQMAFFSNATAGLISGQEMIRGQVSLRNTGLLGIPIFNIENACASASSAFYLAKLAVASGQVDVALAVGSEKLTHEDKAKSFAAFGAAVDMIMLGEFIKAMKESAQKQDSKGSDKGANRSMFMDIYAAWAKTYMAKSGATKEDFARVSVKSHEFASLNPKAQYRERVTIEEVLNSKLISEPLTLLMCAPIGDGAAAVVLASKDFIEKKSLPPVKVRASIVLSGKDRALEEPGVVSRASQLAYEEAGISPQDLDVVELHDAAAPAELITYEELGLCPEGDGPKLIKQGDTALGGRIPVNTSGGLISKGHPIGATGCAQIVELADQLRGRCGERQVNNAKVALAENGGGFLGTDAAAMAITILSV